jgi:(p)ppGpp synthase/HD superfamily hydrolase
VPAEARTDLAEALVLAEPDVGAIALAERLDHARHLHFRDEMHWRPFYTEIREIYLPLANRVQERLAQRLARWAGSFERRFLK